MVHYPSTGDQYSLYRYGPLGIHPSLNMETVTISETSAVQQSSVLSDKLSWPYQGLKAAVITLPVDVALDRKAKLWY
jgi:hypothetical protein